MESKMATIDSATACPKIFLSLSMPTDRRSPSWVRCALMGVLLLATSCGRGEEHTEGEAASEGDVGKTQVVQIRPDEAVDNVKTPFGDSTSPSVETLPTPAGSYQRTCTDIQAHRNSDKRTLAASCKTILGTISRTYLKGFDKCAGDITNNDGVLQCAYPIPEGPYQQFCDTSSITNTAVGSLVYLRARCYPLNGLAVQTSLLDAHQCESPITNVDGALVCTYKKGNTLTSSLPPNTHYDNVRNVYVKDDVLYAASESERSQSRISFLVGQWQKLCTTNLVLRASPGWSPSFGCAMRLVADGTEGLSATDMLPGSYANSCREASYYHFDDTLTAKCSTSTGVWVDASLPSASRCRGDIRNDQGELDCEFAADPLIAKLPEGSYKESCLAVGWDASSWDSGRVSLYAQCKPKKTTAGGMTHHRSRLMHLNCRSEISNTDGLLTCNLGTDQAPAGSYLDYCWTPYADGTRLAAQCDTRGPWVGYNYSRPRTPDYEEVVRQVLVPGDGPFYGTRYSWIDNYKACRGDITYESGEITCSTQREPRTKGDGRPQTGGSSSGGSSSGSSGSSSPSSLPLTCGAQLTDESMCCAEAWTKVELGGWVIVSVREDNACEESINNTNKARWERCIVRDIRNLKVGTQICMCDGQRNPYGWADTRQSSYDASICWGPLVPKSPNDINMHVIQRTF